MITIKKSNSKSYEAASKGKSTSKSLVNPDGTINTPEFAKASKPYKGKTSYK